MIRPALAAGIAGVVLGFVAILDRGIAGAFDIDYLFVTFLGVLAGVVGVYYLSRRRGAARKLTAFDDPERRYRVAVPGDDIDRRLRTLSLGPGFGDSQRRVRNRLREAAVKALVVHAGYDRSAAHDAIEDGTWTDDPIAASFLTEGGEYPPEIRLKAFLGRVDLADVGAQRTIEAIAAVMQS